MKLTQMMSGMMIMTNIPAHLLNSKLITDSQWEEYINLKHRNNILEERYNEALGILSEDDLPCEIDDFMNEHWEYCERNCGVDEEQFKRCWDEYIRWRLERER